MAWLWIIIGGTLYGVVHSLLASLRVKTALEPIFGPWYRLFFNGFAVVSLLPLLMIAWFADDRVMYQVPGPGLLVLLFVQAGAALLAALALWQTDIWRFLGLRQLGQADPLPRNTLRIDGFYRWVRHPAYFFGLVFLWAAPVMTRNSLALVIVFSAYLVWGAVLEERKLVRIFGDPYRRYQRRVPMLIPWKFWSGFRQ